MGIITTTDLIPGLPEEISLQCLIRIPPTSHSSARQVSRQWNRLIDSDAFYLERRRTRNTRHLACLVQAIISPKTLKPFSLLSYAISIFDPASNLWSHLPPIPNGLSPFCQITAVQDQLVVIGGWDPATWDPVPYVWIYSFRTGTWRRGKDMPTVRSSFAAASCGDRVYIAGGHDREKRVLSTAVCYHVGGDTWEEMEGMGEGRDECEGVMVGAEFWVVSGFGPESAGRFVGSAEVYEPGSGRWRRVDGVWKEGRRPRGCVGVVGKGVVCWAEEAVKVGTCGVRVGDRVMVAGMGSSLPGEVVDFYMVEVGEGENKLERLDPPAEFSGFVQSGCCVEV